MKIFKDQINLKGDKQQLKLHVSECVSVGGFGWERWGGLLRRSLHRDLEEALKHPGTWKEFHIAENWVWRRP